ncbi:hypothetical protein D3C79_901140 [compost metagenome]
MFRYQDYVEMISSRFSFLSEKDEVTVNSSIVDIVGYIKIMNDYKREVNSLLLPITQGNQDFFKGELVQILNDVIHVDRELEKFNTVLLERMLKKDYPLILKKD